jgi:hypothetical protein
MKINHQQMKIRMNQQLKEINMKHQVQVEEHVGASRILVNGKRINGRSNVILVSRTSMNRKTLCPLVARN